MLLHRADTKVYGNGQNSDGADRSSKFWNGYAICVTLYHIWRSLRVWHLKERRTCQNSPISHTPTRDLCTYTHRQIRICICKFDPSLQNAQTPRTARFLFFPSQGTRLKKGHAYLRDTLGKGMLLPFQRPSSESVPFLSVSISKARDMD